MSKKEKFKTTEIEVRNRFPLILAIVCLVTSAISLSLGASYFWTEKLGAGIYYLVCGFLCASGFGALLTFYFIDTEYKKIEKSCKTCKDYGEEKYFDYEDKKEYWYPECHREDETTIKDNKPCKYWKVNKKLLKEKKTKSCKE